MNGNLKPLWEGFIKGAKETPRGYFAPLSAACHWMFRVMGGATRNEPTPTAQRECDALPAPQEMYGGYQAVAVAIGRTRQTWDDACLMAFHTMESLDPDLATAAIHALGSRQAAAQWAATPLRELNHRTVYEAMSLDDRDRVYKLVHASAKGRD